MPPGCGGPWRHRAEAAAANTRGGMPTRDGPPPTPGLAARRAEPKQARLRARVAFDLQRGVVLPRDRAAAQACASAPPRRMLLHCSPAASSPARIPGGGRFLPVRVQGNRDGVALGRREHSVAPILRDERHPLAGEVGHTPPRAVTVARSRPASPSLRPPRHGLGRTRRLR